jgi:hypothetical protein
MAIVVDFIRQYAAWVYGTCALIALWYLRVAVRARRERRFAVFTMEREAALNRVYSAWAVTLGVIAVMGAVYLLSTVVYEAVEPLVIASGPATPIQIVQQQGTPTVTPTLPIPEMAPTATPTLRPRPTLRPEPTAVLTPPTPVIQAPRCPDARAAITSPGLQAVVSGMVPITGRAVHESFQYYKLEYGAGVEPSVWSYFDGGDRPVENGRLGTLNTGALPSGTYSVRVIVVDVTGNFPPPCQTTIQVP